MMKRPRLALASHGGGPATARDAESLVSWQEGRARPAIVEFAEGMTRGGSPDFVASGERIATSGDGIDRAFERAWIVVDMKRDQEVVFPFQQK